MSIKKLYGLISSIVLLLLTILQFYNFKLGRGSSLINLLIFLIYLFFLFIYNYEILDIRKRTYWLGVIFYTIGYLVILFTYPDIQLACYLFIIGSLFLIYYAIDSTSLAKYLLSGSLLFLVGSILFISNYSLLGLISFIIGRSFFVTNAFIG